LHAIDAKVQEHRVCADHVGETTAIGKHVVGDLPPADQLRTTIVPAGWRCGFVVSRGVSHSVI
jgi:hypothetical protein